MIQRNKFSDIRLDKICVYCGGTANTRDHVPSKVLLDEPFPENIHNVPCCYDCNQGFSTDEEYFACIVECLTHNSVGIEDLSRPKIKRILSSKSHLYRKIVDSVREIDKERIFEIDDLAFRKILLKLARGHAAFEISEPQLSDPYSLIYKSVQSMTVEENKSFFSLLELEKYPEVGSRLMQQIAFDPNNIPFSIWVSVQDDNYAYMINSGFTQLTVRLLIANFIVAEIIWKN